MLQKLFIQKVIKSNSSSQRITEPKGK